MRALSKDHKVIGLQFSLTAMIFLLIGFTLMLVIRWQLAYPGTPVPVVGGLLGSDNAPGGILAPEFYNQLGAMHGTIMIFLGVVPLAVGGFGSYLIPLMLGAREMAFPSLSRLSYWTYLAAGVVMLAGFFVTGGAANNGWTSYPPLSVLSVSSGQTFWLVGMVLVAMSATVGAINTIVTVIQSRAPGMTFMRMPFFVWAQLVTAFLLLLAFPPLEAAALMQLTDRLVDTSFFLPSGLVVSGRSIPYAGGGNPLLWQHLFWFLAHPEVYVLILPAMGIVAEVLAVNIRKPLWGYRMMVKSSVALGFVSMLVWAHHMFLTGMGTTMSAFFQTTTMIVSIPSVVILSTLIVSLHGGSIRFRSSSLFALAFLPMFGIGGLTGLPLGLAATDIHLHDTYYVIGHFHYVVAPGTLFALFAGVYHWYPRIAGRLLDETLGRIHFWGSFVCINAIFFPMFIQGLAGLNRRLYDGGLTYTHGQQIQHWNVVQGWAAWGLALFQLAFFINLIITHRRGQVSGSNPWRAATLDWATNECARDTTVRVYRGPYEYSVPGASDDVCYQNEAPADETIGNDAEPARAIVRADTGTSDIALGMWLFIASGVMLFGGLFSAYVLLRAGAEAWPHGLDVLSLPSGLLATATIVAAAACASFATGAQARALTLRWACVFLGLAFVAIRLLEGASEWRAGHTPATNNFWAIYYLITTVHIGHVLGGMAFLLAPTTIPAVEARREHKRALARYWQFLALIWTSLFVGLYLL